MKNTEITHVQEILTALQEAMDYIDGQRDYHTDPDSDIGQQVPNKACHVYADLEDAMKRGEILIREWRRDQTKETEQRLKRRYDFVEAPDYDDIT